MNFVKFNADVTMPNMPELSIKKLGVFVQEGELIRAIGK